MNNRKAIAQLKEQLEQMKISGDLTSLDSILSTVEHMEFSPLFKPYGLFFEDYKENEVEILNTHKLIPTQLDDLLIEKDLNKPVNLLLEGDNYQALKLLEKTHKEKIDVIYIDPPYNTGNKDFVYNDAYVNNEDAFRHSKWLSFMDKRLKLAKKLLTQDGVIFISIDDNEQSQLKMLCDQVFGEQNFISNFVWKQTETPPSLAKMVRSNVEYVLAYRKSGVRNFLYGRQTENNDSPLANNSNRFAELEIPIGSCFFPNENTNCVISKGIKNSGVELISDISIENNYNSTPINLKFNCKWSQENLESEIEQGTYLLVKNSEFFSIRYQKKESGFIAPDKFLDPSKFDVRTNEYAKKQLIEIFDNTITNIFDYPKNTPLLKTLLNMVVKDKPYATILDFFAGSGSTGHAVMEMNKEDVGSRQFILATNNEVSSDKELQLLISKGLVPQTPEVKKGQLFKEWKQVVSDFKETSSYQEFLKSDDYNNLGIARQVTYERLKRVINGYTTPKGKVVDGLPNNLKHIVLETVSNLDAKKGVYSQKDVVFFIENVMEDLDAEYFKGESKDKLVYLVGEEEMESLLNQLKESPTDKEVIIYTNIGVINQYKQLEDGFTFKKFPKL